VLLDENLLAEGKEYCSVGDVEPSPDGKLLAFSVDYAGDEKHELRVKNLETGEVYADTIADVTYGVVWGNDNKTFFYITLDHALRPYRLWRYVYTLNDAPHSNPFIHRENDHDNNDALGFGNIMAGWFSVSQPRTGYSGGPGSNRP